MTGLRPIPEGSYLYRTTKRGLTLHYTNMATSRVVALR